MHPSFRSSTAVKDIIDWRTQKIVLVCILNVCLFVEYHHHYSAHSRYVESPHERCAMRVSCKGPSAMYVSIWVRVSVLNWDWTCIDMLLDFFRFEDLSWLVAWLFHVGAKATAWPYHVGAVTDSELTMQVSCLRRQPNMNLKYGPFLATTCTHFCITIFSCIFFPPKISPRTSAILTWFWSQVRFESGTFCSAV